MIIATCALLMLAVPAVDDLPTTAVRMAKPAYVEGEPISVVIDVTNPGSKPVELIMGYPTTFLRELATIRFDGGDALPSLPDRMLIGINGIIYSRTTIAAGETWSTTVSLQNYLAAPRPGEYRIGYTSRIALAPEGHKPFEPFEPLDERRVFKAEGTLTFRVLGPDPAALDKVLVDLLVRIREGTASIPEFDRSDEQDETPPDAEQVHVAREAVERVEEARRERRGRDLARADEALSAVTDPAAIPYLALAIEAAFRADSPGRLGLHSFFSGLDRFAKRQDMRDVVIRRLLTKRGADWALVWLSEHEIRVPAETILAFARREEEDGVRRRETLAYLVNVGMPGTPALEDWVVEALIAEHGDKLESDERRALGHALQLLGNWKVDRDANIGGAIERLTPSLKSKDWSEVDPALEALAPWGHRPDVEALRKALDGEDGPGIPSQWTAIDYLARYSAPGYAALRPALARFLKVDDAETIAKVLAALDRWRTPATRDEIEALLRMGGKARAATLDYLVRTTAF